MSDPAADHPDTERLAAFGRGVLSDLECATIEHHLAGCPACQHALETLPGEPLADLVRAASAAADTAAQRLSV